MPYSKPCVAVASNRSALYCETLEGHDGAAVLRFRRQFSIRSALVAVSVVAALLGMAVVL